VDAVTSNLQNILYEEPKAVWRGAEWVVGCRSVTSDLRDELLRRQAEETAWYRQQQLLLDAEQARRNIIADEEQKLTHQRTR